MSLVNLRAGEKEWILKAAIGVVASIILYSAVVQPVFQDILTARQDVLDAKKRFELHKELQGLKKDLERKESPLATLPERSQILGRISDIAGRTQIRFGTLTPRTEPDGGFLRLRMEMDGRGSFFSLLKFLLTLEKTQTTIKIKDLSLLWNAFSKQQESGSDALQMQLVFETLLRQRAKKNNA